MSALKHAALKLGDQANKIKDKTLRRQLVQEVDVIFSSFNDLKASKPILDISQQLVYISSKIGDHFFYPWRGSPLLLSSATGGLQYEDPDGLLPLSDFQMQIFKSWEIPDGALDAPPVMGIEGADELCQDYLDDCSIVASLLSIHSLETRTNKKVMINNFYPQDPNGMPVLSKSGIYCVKLFINGCERMVSVDDRLPTTKDSKHNLFVRSLSNPGLLWPAIFEKAYLKTMGGYDFLGSYSASDTYALTSWIPEYIYLDGYFQDSPTSSRASLWNRIYKHFHDGNLMVCVGTGPISPKEASALGLISDHDYAILDLREIEETKEAVSKRIALIKNPWVHDQENRITSPIRLDPKDSPEAPNGSFWVSFESLCLRFSSLYLNWNPDLFPNKQKLNFLWSIASISTFMDTQVMGTYVCCFSTVLY